MNTPWRLELVPVGAVAPPLIRSLRQDLAAELKHPVWISPENLDPSPAFEKRRSQYNAITLIQLLLKPASEERKLRMGITRVDLFLPVFTHVFGTAQLGGQAGVASLHRLRPEYSGDPPNPDLLRKRILIETIHELGHILGLVHCRVSWCVMAPSRLPEHIEIKDSSFCPECISRLEPITNHETDH